MRRTKLWLALMAATLTSPLALAFTPPPFPRIAALVYNESYDQASVQQNIARVSIALMTYEPGWETGRAMTFEQSIEAMKKINPNFLAFVYADENEIGQGNASSGYETAWWNEIQANNWWLYNSGSSGTKVLSTWQGGGGPFYQIDNTLFVSPDSSGNRWVDYYAKWNATNVGTPNPSVDGIFTDNVSWNAPVTGDWNRSGTALGSSSATANTWYRLGFMQYFNDLKTLMPGKYQLGNVANWIATGALLTEYSGNLNGGLIEGTLGYSWSAETWGGWQLMMNGYRTVMANVGSPQLVMFHQSGGGSATDYQAMRYGLASCLMDNGYYIFNASLSDNDLPWFDEYNSNLGQAVTGPQTAPWQKGVYRRDFTNGIALVNPKGNGAQTVTLETTFVRLNGTQAPSVNSGAQTTTVSLQDRDGIILLRTAPVAAPATSSSSSSSGTSSASGSSAIPPVPDAPQILSVQ